MAISKGCVAAVRAASGDKLTEGEAFDLLERTQRKLEALEADGAIDGLDARLAQAAREAADEAAIEKALAAKHAALTILKREQTATQVEKLMAGGLSPRDALVSLNEGTVRTIEGGRHSVQALRLAFERRFVGEPMAKIAAERPHIERLLRDRPFLDDVTREMVELREGGKPGSTRNTDAQFVAKVLADAAEASRLALNLRGANIGKLDGWAGAQVHDAAKLRKAGQDSWVQATLQRLDLKRSFPDASPDEAPKILADVWTTIVTGRDRATTAAERGESTGPANLAKSLARHRVLHFKDADAWLAYSAEFGEGHVFDGMIRHQMGAARTAALMETYGPNPQNMLGQIVDTLTRRLRDEKSLDAATRAKQIDELKLDAGMLKASMDEATGLTFAAVSTTAARISAGIRAVQSMAKLGGAVISSAADMVTATANLKFNGMPLGQAYASQVGEFLKGRGTAERREMSFLLGEGFDGLIDHIASPYAAGDATTGAMHRAMTTFFKWNGLTWWTDAMKASHARVLSAHMGSKAGTAFDGLERNFRSRLEVHGIGAKEWAAVGQAQFRALNGNTYVTPDRIRDLPDAALAGLVEGKATPRKIAAARDALELKIGAYFADEVGFGVLEADDATRRVTLQGTRPGTAVGEAMRFVMQFKGYPVAFTQRVLGRAVLGGEGDTAGARLANNAGHIGHLMAGLFVAGYASMTAKDYLNGLDQPRDPTSYKTILAALKQSGGLGIYGDFLFGEANRFGNGFIETLAGPSVGALGSVANLATRARDGDAKAGEALNIALQNTPFLNLFYVRPGLDYLFLNSLRESVSPGFLARQEQRRFKDYGQTYREDREAFPGAFR
jgi:hypothetical protein